MAPTQTHSAAHATVAGKMSVLDRFLPVWIIAAMAVGLLLGRLVPGLAQALDAVKIGSVSLPFSSSSESLVKVGSETIAKDAFYDSFFDLVNRYLVIDQALAD